jgi:2-oxo-4-hydroxy-4-carboxy-5-ureidoimidazoline decarboxylase
MSGDRDGLARFNGLPAAAAEAELLACCGSARWVRGMLAGRPYPDRQALVAAGEAAIAGLQWADIIAALSAHPRIGEAAAGPDRAATWSRAEQAGVAHSEASTRDELALANQAYEDRFGHIFLIFASGRTDAELLDAARARLANDPSTERRVVREELRKITALRLRRLVG